MPITLVQHNVGSDSFTCTISASQAGNALIIGFGALDSAGTIVITGITDNAPGGTNTYVQATNAFSRDGTFGFSDVWYCLSAKAGVTSITVAAPGSSGYRSTWVFEVSGITAFEVANHVGGVLATDFFGAAVNTAGPGFIVATAFVNAAVTQNPKTGNEFNAGGNIDSGGPAACSAITTAGGSHQPEWIQSSSSDVASSTAAFNAPVPTTVMIGVF